MRGRVVSLITKEKRTGNGTTERFSFWNGQEQKFNGHLRHANSNIVDEKFAKPCFMFRLNVLLHFLQLQLDIFRFYIAR